MSKADRLTDQELEIMKIIWTLEQATVRDVYEELLKRRKVAYTTVMTMMKILEGKEFLEKSQTRERAYMYRPSRPKQQVIGGMVRDFLNRVFNGSAKPLLLHLAEQEQLTPEDRAEIARLLKGKKI
jgi:BlaI family transcriptional regulator, penicillinase repressor